MGCNRSKAADAADANADGDGEIGAGFEGWFFGDSGRARTISIEDASTRGPQKPRARKPIPSPFKSFMGGDRDGDTDGDGDGDDDGYRSDGSLILFRSDFSRRGGRRSCARFKVHVTHIKARNLVPTSHKLAHGSTSDPFCVFRWDGTEHRTAYVRNTTSPAWRDSFEFFYDCPLDQLGTRCLEVRVMDRHGK